MNRNYFQGTVENPYHISIGAVVRNNEGNICCHYFKKISYNESEELLDFYLLMRETIEPNETIEETLQRGLLEEFGVEARINKYLGSIISQFYRKDIAVEKTTLYFLCDFVSIDESKRGGDIESTSEIQWLRPEALIPKMKEQGERLKKTSLDESMILERLLNM